MDIELIFGIIVSIIEVFFAYFVWSCDSTKNKEKIGKNKEKMGLFQ